jgi:YVTN family beta-propeller protein
MFLLQEIWEGRKTNMWHKIMKRPLSVAIGLVGLVALAAVACGGAASPKDYDATKSQLAAKEQEVAQLQKQVSSTAPVTVVQAGQLQPAPAGAAPTAWDTAESRRGDLTLFATYDSSGPNAWDPAKHPVVYMSSDGQSKQFSPGNSTLSGLYVMDAYTKEVVASAKYNLGEEVTATSHTVGISPDGQWLYVMMEDRVAATKEIRKLVLIINARTLKIDKVLRHPRQRLHHAGGFKDWQGRDRVVLDMGFGADGGPHFVLDPKDNSRVVRAITYDDVRPMGHPYTAPDPTGKFLYISMGAPWIREADSYAAGIAKFNLETGAVTVIEGVGNHPIGIVHTSDGKYTYVADGTNSLVFKIDNATNKVIGKTSAGVAGPYGLRLNWDETKLWVVGKGEGSHNRGGVLGLIDTKTFTQSRELPTMPIALGGSAASVDHAILHPDPKVNELWVSNMAGWETIVFDLNTYKTKAYIPTPGFGDTHSGGFVRYNPDFTGELLIDMLGPQKPMFATMLEKAKAVAAK